MTPKKTPMKIPKRIWCIQLMSQFMFTKICALLWKKKKKLARGC